MQAVAVMATKAAESAETVRAPAVVAAVDTLDKLEPLLPQLPALVERLETLRSVHEVRFRFVKPRMRVMGAVHRRRGGCGDDKASLWHGLRCVVVLCPARLFSAHGGLRNGGRCLGGLAGVCTVQVNSAMAADMEALAREQAAMLKALEVRCPACCVVCAWGGT